jgi:tetratricopeptide (TPR) repeat protein
MIGTLLNNRYRLDAELGQGGMGVVYRGHDALLERDVAVKVVRDTSLGTEGRARLLQEARAVAQLHHPNIVTVYDAGEAEGLPFIVMELLEGNSLFERQPDSLVETLAIARQVCDALEHAHSHGIVHRDLKPENVIVAADGTAKLTDFGLARSMASRITIEGSITGTVFYLAPEQALGQPVDGRTDLYALGVMLYELTAGRLPFVADDPLAVISQHLYAPVVPPSTYNAAIPPALDALTVQLLSKQPTDRPASAAEVRQLLERLEQRGTEAAARAALTGAAVELPPQQLPGAELSPLDRLALGRLVGREREFAQARALWKQVTSAPGDVHVLLISGEPGVGKTPLVREIVALAGVAGGKVLAGQCYSGGNALYTPIVQIVRDALANLPPSPDGKEARGSGSLSDLFVQPGEGTPRSPLDPQAEQNRLFEGVVALCTALTAHAPLLLVVEDVQWADGGTLSLLRHLARRSRAAKLPLLIVLTYREAEMAEACCLGDVLLDLNRERLATHIKLARFDREQTRAVLVTMFGQEIAPEFVDGIYRETEGNLFFIEELCRALIEAEEIVCEDGRWQRKTSMAGIRLPQSVRETIQARVARLPESAQEVLRLAAIIGREFDFETLQKASEQDEEALVNALELAERAQIIGEVTKLSETSAVLSPGGRRNGHETFVFAHTLIPAALRESVSGLRRRRLHRRVAATIEALRPHDAAALAYHYGEAGDEGRARTYYTQAGDRAAAVYANEDAIRFYSEALALAQTSAVLSPDDDRLRFDLLARRARVYDVIARRDAQHADAEAMLALADKLNDDTCRCDALLALTDVYLGTEYTRAREPAQRAAELAKTLADPVREAQALRRLGWAALQMKDSSRSCQALEEAVARFRRAGLLGEAAICLHTLSLALSVHGLGDLAAAQQAAEEAVALSRQAGNRRQEANSLRRLAIVQMDQGRFAEALVVGEKALTLHRELGDREGECHALNVLGYIQAWLGKPEEMERHLRLSHEVGEAIGSQAGITNAIGNLVWLHYRQQGELEAGLAFLEAQLAKARLAGDEFLVGMLDLHKCELLYHLGHYAPALELAHAVLEITERWAGQAFQTKILSFVARVAAELGDYDGARQSLDAARRHLGSEVAQPIEAAALMIARAHLALLEGQALRGTSGAGETVLRLGLEQTRLASAVLRSVPGCESRLEVAEALLVAGGLHLELAEPADALVHSTEAVQVTTTCPQPVPLEVLFFTHARALRAAGRRAEADDYLRRAYERVTLIASKIHDEALRRGWLENVRVNREILAAWADAPS